ncbi:hypothetical protein GCM10010387_06380 [Streptomyces inusitatus]|uniref:Zinc-finger domain-containing protein n=1 Tax=Streptomyces inusitatus TaxID=68221 RepID=A0A918UKJ1_9ACTN|nr:hypothetical protein [Streptomyces inusitatus]GGZ16500.1 hypothetical protein GCM10010387_06380 [Streptomyces inusitatus]
MTSTADMTQHPDVSEISDLTEGLLPPSQSNALRLHLDACALCADVQASLEEIRGLLGTLPGSARMPVDIAERIDAALAAEALLDSTAPDAAARVSRETSPIVHQREPSSPSRPTGQAKGTTGPGRKRRSRRATAVIGAFFTAAALGVGALLFPAALTDKSGDSQEAVSESQGRPSASAPGTDFSAPGLDTRVRALAEAGSPVPEARVRSSKTFGTEEHSPAAQMENTPTVPPCVQRATGRADSPLAAEPGVYNGESAYLVVFPDQTDDLRVQAYVVASTCADSAPSSTGKLLLKDAYPRH